MSARNIMNDPTIIEDLREREIYTPDFHILRFNKRIPVFVYGTLKRWKPNHMFIKGAEFYGVGYSLIDSYQMRRTSHFPVVFEEKRDVVKGHIRGEVYGVSIEHLHVLDRLESNGSMFRRQERFVILEDQPGFEGKRFKQKPALKCWMYLGVPEFWENRPLSLQHHSRYLHHSDPDMNDKTFFNWL